MPDGGKDPAGGGHGNAGRINARKKAGPAEGPANLVLVISAPDAAGPSSLLPGQNPFVLQADFAAFFSGESMASWP